MSEPTTPSPSSSDREELRDLTPDEARLLARLLEPDFPGRSELVEQAQDSLARTLDSNGSLELAPRSGSASPVERRIPVEADGEDQDGVVIHVLLHVLDGRLNELEIYREDSLPLNLAVDPDRLRVVVF